MFKRRLRNAMILAAGAVGRIAGSGASGHPRVIVLHEVPEPTLFRRRMEWLREHYDVVPLADLTSGTGAPRPRVAVTFDDGYASWHETGAPVLEELGLPATFFVCSGFVGLDKDAAAQFRKHRLGRQQELNPLTRAQLVDLANSRLFEIGGHTTNHKDLGTDIGSEVLDREVEGDRQQLEDWTGEPVRWFAYPFGGKQNVSTAARDYLAASRYEAAFTILPGAWDSDGDPFVRSRNCVDVADPVAVWRARIDGAYDGLHALKETLSGGRRG